MKLADPQKFWSRVDKDGDMSSSRSSSTRPLIGAPLCRYGAHEPVEKGTDRIYWEDLSEECLEYVGSLPDFMLLRLELECPKRLDQTAKEAVTTGCQEGST